MHISPALVLNNGVQIPQVGFGVFQVSTDDIGPAVSTALEAGYRHIDTAALYGNEEGVGEAIRESGLPREEVFVTTKVWNTDQGHDSALAALDASLDRLGMDFVDLYLIHWPTPGRDRFVETWLALEKAYADGRVRAIGVSNFQPNHLRRLQAEGTVPPAVNQVELHPSFAQAELAQVHRELGIVTESWSPLGRAADLDHPTVTGIASRQGRTPAQVIIRWHLQQGFVVIPKSITPARIRSNLDVFDFELDESDMAMISGLDDGNRIGPDPDRFNG